MWAPSEYVKLCEFDRPTAEQPMGLFQCHQSERGDPRARVCAGWAGVHSHNPRGHELLGLRIAAAAGWLTPDEVEAVAGYTTDVPLFTSGAVAAAHGMDEVGHPGVAAQRVMAKVVRRRPEVLDDTHDQSGGYHDVRTDGPPGDYSSAS